MEPWLIAAGLCCGAAVATKWSGILILISVGLMTLSWELDARRANGGRRQALAAMVPMMLVCLVLLPAAVYMASYIGVLDGVVFAPPWQKEAWPRVFGGQQLRMATFHFGLEGSHPYASPAWSWPLGKRAVTYFFEIGADGRYRHILAFANLALWLPALLATVWAAVTLARRRQIWHAEFVVVVAVAGSYLPWLVLTTGRSFVFLHYIVPVLPFLALALAWSVTRLPPRPRRWTAAAIAAVAIAVFVFWAPLIYAWPLSYDDWRLRIPFTDCTPGELTDGQYMPRPHGGPPPDGWCWV